VGAAAARGVRELNAPEGTYPCRLLYSINAGPEG